MSGYIKTSAQKITQDMHEIQEEIKGIARCIEELTEEMQTLGQTWEGPAWQAFQNQVAKDIQNMADVYKKLSIYVKHIEYAGREYRNCENQIGRLVSGIRV